MKNVIYMHSHDTGRYIQPYGHAIATPNLMRLAKESALFRHAYSAAPVCSASRSSLLTGLYPHNHGMVGLAHRGFSLHDHSRHLSRFLRENGYETALFGVQHEASRSNVGQLGYMHNIQEKDDRLNARKAAEWLQEEHDRPFLMSIGFFHTHKVYPEQHEGIDPDYIIPPHVLYDNKENREEFAQYMASARILDECVGIVLDGLKASGREQDTILIYTTDHGVALPNMKCSLYDTGIGVSLMMKYADNPSQGRALDGMVSQIDLFPTLCEMNGWEKPAWLQGVSMLPLLQGQTEEIREELFAEVTYHASYEPMRCIRTKRYKYIRRFDHHTQVVPSNIDAGIGKTFMMGHGLLERKLDKEMLFDLYMDPTERDNLAGRQEYAQVCRQLSGRLEQWMRETGDELRDGVRYPKPAGALINKLSCVEPGNQDYEEE